MQTAAITTIGTTTAADITAVEIASTPKEQYELEASGNESSESSVYHIKQNEINEVLENNPNAIKYNNSVLEVEVLDVSYNYWAIYDYFKRNKPSYLDYIEGAGKNNFTFVEVKTRVTLLGGDSIQIKPSMFNLFSNNEIDKSRRENDGAGSNVEAYLSSPSEYITGVIIFSIYKPDISTAKMDFDNNRFDISFKEE
ncbi:MAG: hypothetical protein FWH52_00910 [Synergistaceae bacterium]|nr:hypothetical protein [Synergistaceae bacterium]